MKSHLKSSSKALLLTLTLALAAAGPRPAHALVVGDLLTGGNGGQPWLFGKVLACIAVLPLCILGEETEGVPAITRQNLLDNGYKTDEAERVITELDQLARRLAETRRKLVVAPEDTRASIGRQLR